MHKALLIWNHSEGTVSPDLLHKLVALLFRQDSGQEQKAASLQNSHDLMLCLLLAV